MGVMLSIVIGMLFAGCGVAYKIGAMGKAYPIQCASILSVFGAAVFAILGRAEWAELNWQTLLAGAVCGITQYLGVRLLRLALKIGPLSPAWCAQSLNFILVVLYASVFLGETLSTWQHLALLAAIGAILAAACDNSGGKKAETLRARLMYGGLLIAILVSISIFSIVLKFCSAYTIPGHSSDMIAESGNLLMFFTYLFMGGASALDLTLNKGWKWTRLAVAGGLMLALCAITAYVITLCIVSKTPAVVLFVISNAMSILGTSLISTFFMKEKRTAAWYFTVGFSLLAILLNR